ncbi:hypothetical protein POVWA2_037470 [Plasmodium ovale wallikeri]|uniref:Uncharacterized protein n=1 Tax=Plasmodium ovale wallikeri TaxID=864142 RepID=A0A1A8Z5R1_PLAOA|nr:hypothetical protein POVWA1_038490 [Plasmodium ovale wallikeri]SBT39281.1 hypothetical protein POVWA2_037470 [Plasmodium ovale wallikeri]
MRKGTRSHNCAIARTSPCCSYKFFFFFFLCACNLTFFCTFNCNPATRKGRTGGRDDFKEGRKAGNKSYAPLSAPSQNVPPKWRLSKFPSYIFMTTRAQIIYACIFTNVRKEFVLTRQSCPPFEFLPV